MYSILAIIAFVYANVLKNIWMFDRNIIFKIFTRILGTNRPSIVLALPFLYFGYISSDFNFDRKLMKNVCVITNILWIAEIVFLRQFYNMNNVHMTIIGAIGTISLYLLIKPDSKTFYEFDYLALLIFGLQYSIHGLILWVFNVDDVFEYILWFCIYTAIIVATYFLASGRIKKHEENNKQNC